MPLIQVTMLTGRTVDQKRKLAQRINDAMVVEAGAHPSTLSAAFHRVSKTRYASAALAVAGPAKKRYSARRRRRAQSPSA